ncbi:condensation domain-containing protein [Streptomyces sp. Ag82_O1-15]|uniref:condensation domain-containing protein n=1 Tax=Streptomyces sp. Ag82_O1-15 TaxID=1938855 RepID=UPI00211C731C|nr:condensation domain-containing protein [Streptomyces sp. Ag82_O1-15]
MTAVTVVTVVTVVGVEQLYWDWSGPLDVARFAAAWQSVVDRECVLRACFEWVAAPRLVLHARAGADIAVCSPAAVTWPQLLRRDRARGFALHRPGLLRLTLLEAEPGGGAGAAPPRVLLTYHPALLDERGVHLLLREFYRAYAGGGVLPGGERRPDLRDHARWLAGQDTTAARQFWARAVPPPRAATRPGRPGGATGQSGPGLLAHPGCGAPETFRLRSWAALRGAAESSALHLVWALLLYRAAGVAGPLPVSFGVQLSGRDIALPGAAGIPGLLDSPLPMTVTVDPAAPLADLLHQVRDTLLDLAAYPWASTETIRAWAPARPPPRRPRCRSRSCCRSRCGSCCGWWSALRCRQHAGAFRRPARAAEGPAQRTRRPGRPRGHPPQRGRRHRRAPHPRRPARQRGRPGPGPVPRPGAARGRGRRRPALPVRTPAARCPSSGRPRPVPDSCWTCWPGPRHRAWPGPCRPRRTPH